MHYDGSSPTPTHFSASWRVPVHVPRPAEVRVARRTDGSADVARRCSRGARDRRRPGDHDRLPGGAGRLICSGEMAYAYFMMHQPKHVADTEQRRARCALRVHISLHRDPRRRTTQRERRQVRVRLTRRSFVQAAAGSLLLPGWARLVTSARTVTAARWRYSRRECRNGRGAAKTIDGFNEQPEASGHGRVDDGDGDAAGVGARHRVGAQPGRHAGAGFL